MGNGRYFIEAVLVQGRSVSEVARTHGVSRRWIQKLLARYKSEGEAGLVARSRRPRRCPSSTPLEVEEHIIRLRKQLTDLGVDAGPQTIAYHLATQLDKVPSPTTIARVLVRRGFVTPQPHKRPKSSLHRFVADLPNEMWQSDFTYWQLADGAELYIVNYLDDHSRLCLSSRVYQKVNAGCVVEQFHATAAQYGIPVSMLTDNGRVYTTSKYGTKVLIETELERLGVIYKHGRPYHPQTQGKVERWHQTLKKYLTKQPSAQSIAELQAQVDAFVSYYNDVRPHSSLKRKTPRSVFDSKIKAHPNDAARQLELRVRNDTVDSRGRVSLRYHSKMHHIYIGNPYRGTRIKMLIDDLDIRVITADGEMLRHFTLDPTRDYQPMNSGR